MRWVFWIVLAVNVVFAGWHFGFGDSDDTPSPPQDAHTNVARHQVPPLQLWSELSTAQQAALASVAAGAQADTGDTAANAADRPLCELVGPLADEVTAKQVVQRLRAVDVESAIRELDMPVGTDYWVHVGPFASRTDALKKLAALQHADIDSYLITRGPLADAVSLGLFSRRAAAEQLLERRRGQGVQARITALPHHREQRWVVFPAAAAGALGDGFWTSLVQDFAGVGRKESFCQDIASAAEVE